MSTTRNSADPSDALDHGVRAGLVTYGIVHLVVAWTALQLAFGDSSGKASQTGALRQLAQDSMGGITLYVAALGFVALVVWQGLEAAFGHRSEDGGTRVFKRGASAAKAVVFTVLAYTSIRIASGSGGGGSGGSGGGGGGGGSGGGSGGSRTDTFTAQLMSAPGGQLLVGAIGVGVIGAGGYLAYKGVTRKFTKRLDRQATSGDRRTPVVVLGTVGYVAKGVVLAAVGGLFVVAAVQHQPQESGGLDQALRTLLQQPFGAPLLVAVAVGLACYGVYCFLWARHLDR